MHIAHLPIFVVLSAMTACLGSWTALDLFRRVRAHTGPWRNAWLAAAAIAMGLSIWSMHFIAMLGFDPGAEVRYDVGLTVLSLLLAIAVTAFAFFSAIERTPRLLIVGGLVMGAGICIMHYVGMAAIITQADIENDATYVVLAFLVAVSASIAALVAAMRERTFTQRALAAVVLGFAIVGMHYTGMLGVRVAPRPDIEFIGGGIGTITLAFSVAGGTVSILVLALVTALSDRRFEAIAAREALRSEQQLRAIIDNLPLGVFVAAAPSGEIRFANTEAEKLLGHTLQGQTIWTREADHGAVHADGRRLAPEEHAVYAALHEARRVGPRLQAYRRGDGALAQFDVTAAPIPNRSGESALVVAAFQDVTAKLIAEDAARQTVALRDSEERFRLIAEQAPVMLWMSDVEGRPIYINKALREFCSAPEGAVGFDWTSGLANEGYASFIGPLQTALRTQNGFIAEARFQRADGAERIIHTNASARFNAQRQFLGLIGVNTDVTEARQAQTDLKRINELLEVRVAAALADKAAAEAALVHAQRMEALGRLTGGLAHDFNNLLTVVIGALDIILRHPENAERRTRLGEAALAAARRGERLTGQLLAFARRQPLQPEACDLNELIRESEPLIRGVTPDTISLQLRLCATRAVALIDPAQLEAALLNLIVNAVDAISAGGEISIETDVRDVADGEAPNLGAGRYFLMRVCDTGPGMSPAVMDRIFEPFFTTKAPGKGTGLGLSQVYGFVRQSGGEVRVESKEGAGACFDVYLPVGDMPSEGTPLRKAAARTKARTLKVLLAEDDSTVGGIVETMLTDLGHEVARAVNAAEALQIVRSARPLDLLLSDVVMAGGMNGVELAGHALALRPQLRVLLNSGYAGESLDAQLLDGAWPFLRKPFQQTELAAAIAGLFDSG